MNKIAKLLSIVSVCYALSTSTNAQKPTNYCRTTEMQKKIFDANPQLYLEHLKENARLEAIDKSAYAKGYKDNTRATGTVYIIPVVFHILHQYGRENISDAQVNDAIRTMTEDFRKLNADNVTTAPVFQGISSDSKIEFRLAQKDPNGNCTNGIDRIVSTKALLANDGSKLNPWNRNNYLNIWVVKTFDGDYAGYGTFPGGDSLTDGIIIKHIYIGAIGTGTPNFSHTLSHEVGHFLSLDHVWGPTNDPEINCGDDGILDTPETKGHFNNCPLSDQTCTPGVIENVQNFMEYSYCFTMFTEGQSTRMRATLDPISGPRKSLCTIANLTTNTGVSSPLALCQSNFTASFAPNVGNVICQGTSLTYTDASYNVAATSWTWSFPGGIPSSSTVASPIVQYNSAGVYDVSLTVSNISGTQSTTKTAFVVVNSSTATYANPIYTEGFEGAPISNSEWRVGSLLSGGSSWTQDSAAAATGTKSVRVQNLSAYNLNSVDLIGPSIDMTKISGVSNMTFKVAHAQKASSGLGSADKLEVFASTDCGKSWTLRRTLSGATLSTAGVNSIWTAPTSNQWVTQTASLSSYTSQTNLYFMFRFTSNGGNNVYIDDINIGTSTIGIEEELGNSISFNIYPNPLSENTNVGFNLLSPQKVSIALYDILGQQALTLFSGNLSIGEHAYPVGAAQSLNPGIYFVKLTVGEKCFTKKLVIKEDD